MENQTREGVEKLPIGDVLTFQQKEAIFRLELAAGQHPGAARKLYQRLLEGGVESLIPPATGFADHPQTDELNVVLHELLEVFVSCIDNARG